MADRYRFRAVWHDYNGGIYFVTICSYERQSMFGMIQNKSFYPTSLGDIIIEHIGRLSEFHEDVDVWNYVVMPNHIHIVLSVVTRFIASAGLAPFAVSECSKASERFGCLKPPRHGDVLSDQHHNSRLAVIIGAFKAGVTREIRRRIEPDGRTRKIASLQCWQSPH